MTKELSKDSMIISVNVPKKIVHTIDKMKDMGLIKGRTEFCRNAIVDKVICIANLKEMIEILSKIGLNDNKKKLTEGEEARKYFKWLKNEIDDINEIARLNGVETIRVQELLLKYFNIKLN